MGRGIPKLVSLFGDIRDIIDDADQHGLRLGGDLDDTELDNLDEAEAVMKKQQYIFAISLRFQITYFQTGRPVVSVHSKPSITSYRTF